VTNPFNRTTLWVVSAVVVVSLVVTIVLTLLGPAQKFSASSDGYSVSAIGHKGLVRLLEKLDVPVVLSRNNSSVKAQHGLLIIAEPKVTDKETDRLKALIASAPANVLVVLPKWYGFAGDDGRWIDDAELKDLTEVDQVLTAIGLEEGGLLSRAAPSMQWLAGELPQPVLRASVQTIAGRAVTPVISDRERALVGHYEHEGKTIWILTDPDVINNAGLSHPENAQLAVALIDRLRDGGPVVFDETVHGHAQTPSLLHVLFEFPLVLATMQVLICALLVVWAAMVRFGPKRAPPPPLAPGKDFLIANTAALLRYGGHDAAALERYLGATIQVVRHALHAPDSLGPSAVIAWLERVRETRGSKLSLPELQNTVAAAREPQRVLEVADQVYRWRMEMTHGITNRS
jgi:hypothetical protein